jgi:hypothetical protein
VQVARPFQAQGHWGHEAPVGVPAASHGVVVPMMVMGEVVPEDDTPHAKYGGGGGGGGAGLPAHQAKMFGGDGDGGAALPNPTSGWQAQDATPDPWGAPGGVGVATLAPIRGTTNPFRPAGDPIGGGGAGGPCWSMAFALTATRVQSWRTPTKHSPQ